MLPTLKLSLDFWYLSKIISLIVLVFLNEKLLKNYAQLRFFLMLHSRPLRILKKKTNRPLQRFSYLLQANELPLRHLIPSFLDGPRISSGSCPEPHCRNRLLCRIFFHLIDFRRENHKFNLVLNFLESHFPKKKKANFIVEQI
jgi:hypothetical protein